MSFGFIQLFFFISLGIVLGLILLLCYYLKNKIELLEKQSSSFRDILGNLIKEIKIHFQEHEENAGEKEETGEKEQVNEMLSVDVEIMKNEGITIHIDDEPCLENDEEVDLEVEEVEMEVENRVEELDLEEPIPELVEEVVQEQAEGIEAILESVQIKEEIIQEEEEASIMISEAHTEDGLLFDDLQKPFRKMSLPQLKQYAITHNLATYVHKMKKDELIRLLEEKSTEGKSMSTEGKSMTTV